MDNLNKAGETVCGTCGASPCYLICQTQDPYRGDHAAENDDYEFGARHDSHRDAIMEARTAWEIEEFEG